jgi:hypothetical protein
MLSGQVPDRTGNCVMIRVIGIGEGKPAQLAVRRIPRDDMQVHVPVAHSQLVNYTGHHGEGEPVSGVEPLTCRLQDGRSAT